MDFSISGRNNQFYFIKLVLADYNKILSDQIDGIKMLMRLQT